ncbi:MAG: phage portal protein [Tardiphaga sp.]
MSLWSRIMAPFTGKAVEGEYRSGPYYLPLTGGMLSADVGQYINWWQNGHDVDGVTRSAMVEACVSAYSQTIAMCPGDHWRSTDDGGRERVAGSALARILRSPNEYQTISDFMLNAVRDLYSTGNSYALGLRNLRFEIEELHLMDARNSTPQVAATGELFYLLSGNEVIAARFGGYPLLVPARDVLHIKLHSPRHTRLIGESPMQAAAGDIAASGAITAQQMQFYLNQARPGIMLATDKELKQDQMDELRRLFDLKTRGENAGKTPILSHGLKPIVVQTTAKDAEIAEMFKMTQQNIALAFRIPMQILGIGTAAGGSTATLMQDWVSSSLGFALNHVEEAFGKTFALYGQPDEYVEFSTAALLRSNYKDRIEALARGVISGIYSPNEARGQLELPEVEFGDEPRVQQQVVPLSAAEGIPSAPGPGAAPPAPPALPPPETPPEGDDQPEAKVVEFPDDAIKIRRRFRASHARYTI